MTECVDYIFGDVYLSLWRLQICKILLKHHGLFVGYKPLMVWVWIGCLFMAIGGFVAIFGKQSLAWPSKNERIAKTNLSSKQNEKR